MSPTAELPVIHCWRSNSQDDIATSSIMSSRETGRQAYFRSPYTRGVVATGSGGNRNVTGELPSSPLAALTPRCSRRTSGDSNCSSRSSDDSHPSRKGYGGKATGYVLPTIESKGGKRQLNSLLARDSPSENASSGATPRDGCDTLTSSRTTPLSPPKKQSKTSPLPSRDHVPDVARFHVSKRATTSSSFESSRQSPRPANGHSSIGGQKNEVTPSGDDGDASCHNDEPTSSMTTLEVPSRSSSGEPADATAPTLRPILALYRCHDCSMENVRTFVNGMEHDKFGDRRAARHRCSRLLPSAAATAVLMGLSLSPRPSLASVDDDDDDDQMTIASVGQSSGRETTRESYFVNRKCVRFEPVVYVFCDETSTTMIHQLRPTSGPSTDRPATRGASFLLPPLQPMTSSAETTMTVPAGQTEDLPAVVQRYMVRNNRHQDQRRASFPVGQDAADYSDSDTNADDDNVASSGKSASSNRVRAATARRWKP